MQAQQSSLEDGHFFELGAIKSLERLSPAIATNERMRRGLDFSQKYLHMQGTTTGSETGGLLSKLLQDATNAVFGEDTSPLNFYFIPDGKTIAQNYLSSGTATMIAETEKLLDWGEGRSRFLPKQAKLFADGAIFSQLMQMRDGYTDGYEGEWMMEHEHFSDAFQAYWGAGYQISVHQNGDAGLDLVLVNLESA